MSELSLDKIDNLVGSVKSEIYIGYVKNEEEMNKNIIKTIDEEVGENDYETNVMAQMTKWEMWHYPGFNKLGAILLNIVNQFAAIKKVSKVKFDIVDMWGCKYKDGDYAHSHDHWPAVWSMVYYPFPEKDSPNLFFPDFNCEIKPEHGKIVIFPGHYKHQVNKKPFKGYRYVVSANIR